MSRRRNSSSDPPRNTTRYRPSTIAGLTYTFERESAFTGLMITRDPGVPWVWLGSALTVLGMCLTMMLKHRRVWARIEPAASGATIALAAPERNDTLFERWFRALVNELGTDHTQRKGTHHAG